MLDTILATKIRMSQAFVDDARVPVTVVKAGPCTVTQIKSEDKDGYWAVQMSLGQKRTSLASKSVKGHLKNSIKTDKTAPRYLREVRLDQEPEIKVGDKITLADIFNVGDTVTVTGVSKGKGFQGAVKRWGFAGGPKTHGQSDRHRAPGSIGQGTTPGRVWKGKKMAGRMGGDTVTIKNLKVVAIDTENGEMQVSGPIPGSPKTLLTIKRTSEAKVNTETNEEN